jgi:hypothetical protein
MKIEEGSLGMEDNGEGRGKTLGDSSENVGR